MIFWFKKAPMKFICNILVPSNEITRLLVAYKAWCNEVMQHFSP